MSVAIVKPEFEVFLKPIVNEMKNLELGMAFDVYYNGLKKILKFFLIIGVFDKPARSSFLNIISYNGYYGCLKCIQPGITKNHVYYFEFCDDNPSGPLRNKYKYFEDCENKSFGVKGKIELSDLRFFSPLHNTNINYMHSVLEGVVKRFFRYWFDENGEQSLKAFTIEIDKRLLSIKPPSFIPITPRSIDQRAKWRANEYLNFLLFYSLPVFFGIMESRYYLNLMKLVVGMECLLDKRIKRANLEIVQEILVSFVKEAQQLYSSEIMLSGMHEILHLVDCTLTFGPLNCTNSFQFEELNRKIISLIFGKDLMGDEFLKLFSILQALTYYSFLNENPVLKEYFKEHNIIKSCNKKRLNEAQNGVFSPLGEISTASLEVNNQVLNVYPNAALPLKTCNRISFNGIIYTNVKSQTKRCDYCAKTLEPQENYGLIEIFVFNEVEVYVILQKITKYFSPFFDPIHRELKSKNFICSLTKRVFITTIENLAKAFLIRLPDDRMYISTFSTSHLFIHSF